MKKSEITARELGLDPASHHEPDLFAWLIASFLFGKRIQQDIAKAAFEVIVRKHQVDSVAKMASCSHRQLVAMLGEGRYARYDESTATRLAALGQGLQREYHGKVGELLRHSTDRADCARRLQAYAGIGPKTAQIFLREAWPD
ncbi:DNA methylase [Pseudomonas sp. HR96]|uniref:DNA methylase n=1 Tax=Pseudomonas sp. HR96 TaxID=1027966 RepID=UPI002A748180|nr:DNA methylase [Pseudomonas sp. HR96]WPP01420.1 DNA methylase [Pseudomonas sp. HR96]